MSEWKSIVSVNMPEAAEYAYPRERMSRCIHCGWGPEDRWEGRNNSYCPYCNRAGHGKEEFEAMMQEHRAREASGMTQSEGVVLGILILSVMLATAQVGWPF